MKKISYYELTKYPPKMVAQQYGLNRREFEQSVRDHAYGVKSPSEIKEFYKEVYNPRKSDSYIEKMRSGAEIAEEFRTKNK